MMRRLGAAALALGLFAAAGAASGTRPAGPIPFLFLLAVWMILPLGLPLLPRSGPVRLAGILHPIAAIAATTSFLLPPGPGAAALAAPWLALDGLLAAGAIASAPGLLRGGAPSLLVGAAMLLPSVGGVALVFSRMGQPLGGFPEPIVLLTAIHFHFTGFAAPLLSAAACAALRGGWGLLARAGGLGLLVGTALVAVGFLHSPALKSIGVGVLVLGVSCAAVGQLAAAPERRSLSGRLLLRVSSGTVLFGMILAALYEHGFATGRSWLSIPQMAWTHGILNGPGYSLAGLLAWSIERAPASGADADPGSWAAPAPRRTTRSGTR